MVSQKQVVPTLGFWRSGFTSSLHQEGDVIVGSTEPTDFQGRLAYYIPQYALPPPDLAWRHYMGTLPVQWAWDQNMERKKQI